MSGNFWVAWWYCNPVCRALTAGIVDSDGDDDNDGIGDKTSEAQQGDENDEKDEKDGRNQEGSVVLLAGFGDDMLAKQPNI